MHLITLHLLKFMGPKYWKAWTKNHVGFRRPKELCWASSSVLSLELNLTPLQNTLLVTSSLSPASLLQQGSSMFLNKSAINPTTELGKCPARGVLGSGSPAGGGRGEGDQPQDLPQQV